MDLPVYASVSRMSRYLKRVIGTQPLKQQSPALSIRIVSVIAIAQRICFQVQVFQSIAVFWSSLCLSV